MWDKHFKIAERQYEAGKKTADMHAIKALEAAQASGNAVHVAKTLALLGSIYAEYNRELLVETLEKSVAAAEKAYGADSHDLVEALEEYATALEIEGQADKVQTPRMKALDIRLAREAKRMASTGGQRNTNLHEYLDDETDESTVADTYTDTSYGLVNALGDIVTYLAETGKHAEAKPLMDQWLVISKEVWGEDSDFLEELLPFYIEIEENVGDKEEAKILRDIVDAEVSSEEAAIAKGVTNRENKEDLDQSIIAFREAVEKLEALAKVKTAKIKKDDSWGPLKRRIIAEPASVHNLGLATILRAKWQKDTDEAALVEAEKIVRALLEAEHDHSFEALLMHIMLDRATTDAAHYAEVERLIGHLDETIDAAYTKALMLYRQEGASKPAKEAIATAFKLNPHVMPLFAGQMPEDSDEAEKIDAIRYANLAMHAWATTDGAVDFTTETMLSNLSPAMRRRVEQMVEAAKAAANVG
jgi:tetratricopeptide (TPR) repeat protein